MYLPGRILHYTTAAHPPPNATWYAATLRRLRAAWPTWPRLAALLAAIAAVFCCACCRRPRVAYVPRWARRRNLTRLQVSGAAFADHMPDRVHRVVRAAYDDALAAAEAAAAAEAERTREADDAAAVAEVIDEETGEVVSDEESRDRDGPAPPAGRHEESAGGRT